ncbi:MAG: DNA-formamidopyrimidine glycosylase family protein [bacterium]
MQELPELEVTRDRLRLALTGRLIIGAEARQPACLKTVEPPLVALAGQHVRSVNRLGKFLVFAAENRLQFCVHLMLNGRLALGPAGAPWTRHHLAALHLDRDADLRVIETGTRRRVELHLVTDPKNVDRIARLGLDPLGPEFTLPRFRSALGRRNHVLKRFLTNQDLVAGIGNCYSDEILLEARLSPFATTGTLKPEEAIRLCVAVKKVLHDAILRLRPLDRLPERRDRTFLRVHGRLGQPCGQCGEAVRQVSFSDSAIYYCPACQTGGRVLADRRLSRLLK